MRPQPIQHDMHRRVVTRSGRVPYTLIAVMVAISIGGWVLWRSGLLVLLLCLLEIAGNWGHQEYADNCVDQIEPARQMEELFDDCRHNIVYGRSGPRWDATAYFGGRYELNMQVPVTIYSSRSGEMNGDPSFLLLEVGDASARHASYSDSIRFDFSQWKQVYEAGGDFSVIGFEIDPTPVPGFDDYAASCRGE